MTSKTTKDYIIGLTLSNKNNPNFKIFSSKIKKAENNLKDYQKKIKKIKEKHKNNKIIDKEIIPKYNKDDMTQKVEYDSFNKINYAIRVTTQIENMAGNILVDLNGQNNVMKNGIHKVGELNEELDTSKDYLNKMINKEKKDKKIIFLVGFFLFMITLFVFIYKVFQKFRTQK